MTMQTNSLSPQLLAPTAAAPGARANATPQGEGMNFGATLTRQIEQRQLEQRQALMKPQAQPAMPAPGAAPKPQPGSKPPANEARAPAREASHEPAREVAKEAPREATQEGTRTEGAAKGDTAEASVEKSATEGEDGGKIESGARSADAVVDMLALMASLNGKQPAPAVPAAGVLETAAAASGALLAGLKEAPDTAAGTRGAQGTDVLGAAAGRQQAEPGIDLRALGLGKAEAAKPQLEPGAFAARLHDSVAKEAMPTTEALTSLATQANVLQGAQAAGAVPTDRLSARVGTPAWDNQVGQKVIWMVGGEEQSATLELNPPDLGPVQVVLNVSNDLASVTFSSQQLEVRQALENALPRLREMMNDSGIALGNASVNAGSEGRQGQDGQGSGRPGGGGGDGGDSAVADAAPRARTSILGGAGAVDIFA